MLTNGNLDFFTIDFHEGGKAGKIARDVGINMLVPGAILFNGVRLLKNNEVNAILSNATIIRNGQELAQYENAQGNKWIICNKQMGIMDEGRQYYIRHPKKGCAKLLIPANDFSHYIYDEYCRELVNYCSTHCPAKSILVENVSAVAGETGGGFKKINAEVNAQAGKKTVYAIRSDEPLKQVEPLKAYYWLEPGIRQAIDALVPGAKLEKTVTQDFTFGIQANVWKWLKADLNLARNIMFHISVQC